MIREQAKISIYTDYIQYNEILDMMKENKSHYRSLLSSQEDAITLARNLDWLLYWVMIVLVSISKKESNNIEVLFYD